jgi:hypothetical protein
MSGAVLSPRYGLGVTGDQVHSVLSKYSGSDDMTETSDNPGEPLLPKSDPPAPAAEAPPEKTATESYAGEDHVTAPSTLGQLVKRVRDESLDKPEPTTPASNHDDADVSPKSKLRSGKVHWQKLKQEVKKDAAQNQARKTFMRMLTGVSAKDIDEKTNSAPAATGPETKVTFDDQMINRISLRLDGFESYSVLGALVLGFALNNITAVSGDDFVGVPWLFTFLFVVICVITSFASMYTLMVFALCSLYGKTSLGIKNDAGYTKFIQQTAPFREWAFINFMVSLMGTCISVLYLLILKTPSQGLIASPICAACIYFGQKHVRSMIKIASATVFS